MKAAFPARAARAAGLLALYAGAALGGELSGFELRLGGVAHDALGIEKGEAGFAASLIVPLPAPAQAGASPLVPRLEIGGVVGPLRRTSLLHAGGNWQIDLAPAVFLDLGLGIALHDGATGSRDSGRQSAMGCRFAFREAAGLGYRLGGGWSVVAGIEHYSNAGLCRRNRGLTHLGARVGYRF